MMEELTDEMINDAIKNCHWKKMIHGIPICAGVANPCIRTIESGRCDTLIKLFKDIPIGKEEECEIVYDK